MTEYPLTERKKLERRRYELRSKYGISLEMYDVMLRVQKGVCFLCQKPEPKRAGKEVPLAVDHCHTTGVVRRLLCSQCNLLVGYYEKFRNNRELAGTLEKYVSEHAIVE